MNNKRAKLLYKICTSHFIVRVRKGLLKVCMWEGVGDLQYIDPHSHGRQRCVFLVLQCCSTGGPEAHSLLYDGFLYCILSPTGLQSGVPRAPLAGLSLPHLISNFSGPQLIREPRGPLRPGVAFPTKSYQQTSPTVWLLVLTELYNSSTTTQSPTQSLEWHVWSSSSGNNCHSVHRSLSSGASLWSGTFTLSHIISRAHLRDFLS